MKTLKNKQSGNTASLHMLLDDLVGELPGLIRENHIAVKNEIPAELRTQTDPEAYLPLVSELLNTVMSNARDTCISISAERYRDVLTVRVVDRNNYNGYALDFGLMSVGRLAREIGGDVVVDGVQKRVATISLSIPDNPELMLCSYGAMA